MPLGDVQGDMTNLGDETIKYYRDRFPAKIDLLFAPIDWARNIVKEPEALIVFPIPNG